MLPVQCDLMLLDIDLALTLCVCPGHGPHSVRNGKRWKYVCMWCLDSYFLSCFIISPERKRQPHPPFSNMTPRCPWSFVSYILFPFSRKLSLGGNHTDWPIYWPVEFTHSTGSQPTLTHQPCIPQLIHTGGCVHVCIRVCVRACAYLC